MTRRRLLLVFAGSAIAIAIILAVLLSGSPSHTPSHVTRPPSSTPSPSSTESPPPAPSQVARPFPRGLFEHPVTRQPIAADSAAIVEALVAQIHRYYGAVTVNGLPVLTAGPDQVRVPIAVQPKCGNFTKDIGTVPVPPDAYSNGSTDNPIVIFQPSSHTAWELWKAKRVDGRWQACWGGRIDTLTSDGVFRSPYGLSASGISYLATTITDTDVVSGSINHTLALDVVRCDYHTAPATRGDCGRDPGEPSEGTWFRMPSSVALPIGLTPYARLVFRALQTYGAVVTDQAGAVAIQGEDSKDWIASGRVGISPTIAAYAGQPRYGALDGIPWSDLVVIVPPAPSGPLTP